MDTLSFENSSAVAESFGLKETSSLRETWSLKNSFAVPETLGLNAPEFVADEADYIVSNPDNYPDRYLRYLVRCFCGNPISRLSSRYETLIRDEGYTAEKALDSLSLRSPCCRATMLTPVTVYHDIMDRNLIREGRVTTSRRTDNTRVPSNKPTNLSLFADKDDVPLSLSTMILPEYVGIPTFNSMLSEGIPNLIIDSSDKNFPMETRTGGTYFAR